MKTSRRILVASAALLLAPCVTVPAQIPGPSARNRVEVAEVRGLEAAPTNAESEFEAAKPGPNFQPTVRAVLVRFKASAALDEKNLTVVWVTRSDSGGSTQLAQAAVDSGQLVPGVTQALTGNGQPLARGHYQVSLVGANNRYYRTVEFSVGVRPASARRSKGRVSLEKAYFDQYSFLYPNTYTPQATVAGMTGILLINRAPFTLMFAVLSDEDSDTVLPQGRAVVRAWLARLDSILQVRSTEAYDIPADQLGPEMTFGKVVLSKLNNGLTAQAYLYSKPVAGRKVLVGYAMIRGERVQAGYEQFLTTDPDAVADEFFDMADTLKGGTPWGQNTPGERKP